MPERPPLQRILSIPNPPTKKGAMNRMPARESIWMVGFVVVREASIATTKLQENRRRTRDPRFYRATQSCIVSFTDAGCAIPNHLRIAPPAVKDEADVQVRGRSPVKLCHMDAGRSGTTDEGVLNRPPVLKTVQRLGDQMASTIESRVRHPIDRRTRANPPTDRR